MNFLPLHEAYKDRFSVDNIPYGNGGNGRACYGRSYHNRRMREYLPIFAITAGLSLHCPHWR